MLKGIGIVFVALTVVTSIGITETHADQRVDLERLLKAVFLAEGGEKAKVPYGLVYSDWCLAEPGWCRYYAREVLRVHLARCEGKEDVIACVGSYYCPPSAHRLNRNWVKNVRYFYERGEQ